MNDFIALDLPGFLVESLERAKIVKPTPIQADSVPPALRGSDVLASAQTGSGKTIAYLIPLIVKLFKNPEAQALVLLPTRELAVQVKDALVSILDRAPGFGWTVLIGGEPINKQFFQLRRNPRIIIGTPGRINDHLDRGSLKLDKVGFFVLDEVDRMLDMGFAEQLEDIRRLIPQDRQTLLFSATVPPNIERVAQKYLKDPVRVEIGSTLAAASEIKQETVKLAVSEKFSRLLSELEQREGSAIVFVKTKRGAEQLAWRLKDESHSAIAIHGNLQQRKRERVIKSFRRQESRIMVATDIAARGLDVPHIQHVINYDLPGCPEDYIHRIGRTGRAGSTGCAVSFISPEDNHRWRSIHRFMNPGEKSNDSYSSRPRSRSGYGSRSRFGSGSNSGSSFGRRREFAGDRSSSGSRGGFGGERGSFGDRASSGDRGGFGSERSSSGGDRNYSSRRKFSGNRSSSSRPVRGQDSRSS